MTSTGGDQAGVDDALRAEDDGEIRFRRGCGDGGPGPFEERRIGRRHVLPRAAVTGDEAFREADETGVFDERSSDRLFGQRDRFRGSRRELDVGECDSKRVH